MKACSCQSKIDKLLQEQTGDPEAQLAWAVVFGPKTTTYPQIVYTYRKKDRAGNFTKKKFEGTMIPTYCPFCGRKYGRAK